MTMARRSRACVYQPSYDRSTRVGAEFAADLWGSFSYTAPSAETHLATFRDSVLVTYGGGVSTFSSW